MQSKEGSGIHLLENGLAGFERAPVDARGAHAAQVKMERQLTSAARYIQHAAALIELLHGVLLQQPLPCQRVSVCEVCVCDMTMEGRAGADLRQHRSAGALGRLQQPQNRGVTNVRTIAQKAQAAASHAPCREGWRCRRGGWGACTDA